jgi:hypothetical protein
VLAFFQLREAKNIARGQFLLALDQSLAPFEQVRRQVNRGEQPGSVALRRYIACFERIGLLLRERQLKIGTVDQLYGSRFAKLVNGGHLGIVQDRPEEWRGVVWLWEDLRPLRGLAAPPTLSSNQSKDRGE